MPVLICERAFSRDGSEASFCRGSKRVRCLLTGVFAVFVVDVDGGSNESDTRCNRS